MSITLKGGHRILNTIFFLILSMLIAKLPVTEFIYTPMQTDGRSYLKRVVIKIALHVPRLSSTMLAIALITRFRRMRKEITSAIQQISSLLTDPNLRGLRIRREKKWKLLN